MSLTCDDTLRDPIATGARVRIMSESSPYLSAALIARGIRTRSRFMVSAVPGGIPEARNRRPGLARGLQGKGRPPEGNLSVLAHVDDERIRHWLSR